jgi:hypothetical protein
MWGKRISVKGRIAGALVLFIAATTGPLPASERAAGWQAFQNRDYGFALAFPKHFTNYSSGLDYVEAIRSYIPICHENAVACFIYNGNEYQGTNFESAGLSVSVLRDRRTENACNAIDAGSSEIREKTINGTRFHSYDVVGEASSHWIDTHAYRTFKDGVCFEIFASIAGFERLVAEPPPKPFDPVKLKQELEEIVHTFRFTGPVVDGPDWERYSDNSCGGSFEYPDTDTIHTDIEYSNWTTNSNEITCAWHFENHGRKYSLSAKVRLDNWTALEAWLASYGFPDLSKATVVGKSEYFTEYKAGFHYYVFGRGTLYILSVSDDSGHILNPDSNRIFMHFLRSFKPE